MSNTVVSKASIHCVGANRNGYGAMLNTVNAAGRRIPLIKCRDNFGAVDEPLALWPETLCVGAFTDFDGFPFDFAAFEARAKLNPKIKVWEVLNEINGEWSAQADLYISLAPKFKANGWALCMFNCASGTPPMPGETGNAEAYAQIARACKFMKDNGYTAYLGFHEYVSGGETIGRYKHLADYLQAQNALIPIVITEWLFETHPGDSAFMAALQFYDQVYMPDSRVIGCATWTLGGGGWGGSNYQTALPAMGDYIASVAPVAIDPPPAARRVFDHWLDVDTGLVIGTNNPIDIVVTKDIHVRAITREADPAPQPSYDVITSADFGSVTGGGTYAPNAFAHLEWFE